MSKSLTFKRLAYNNGCSMKIQEKTFNLPTDLASDEIIVKISNAALNPVDLLLYHTSRYIFFKRGVKGVGRDFSGTVYATGSNKSEYKEGDLVSGLYMPVYGEQGTIAQYLKLKPKETPMGKIPSTLSLQEASAFPLVFATAVSILRKFHVPDENSRVLVIGGATSVGQYVLQLLKNHHHAKSIISVNSESSASLTKSFGADTVIDYNKQDVAQTALSLVQNDFGGEKFDLIIDCVGNNDIFPVINDVLKPKTEKAGYVTIVGDQIADYNSSIFSFLKVANLGFFSKMVPYFRSYNYGMVATAEDFYPLAKKLFEENKLKVVIDSTFTWTNYEKAYEKLSAHKARGKIVLNFE